MDLLKSLQISASGLSTERTRLEVISANIANANTTRTPGGGPYKRLQPVVEAVESQHHDSFHAALGERPPSEY